MRCASSPRCACRAAATASLAEVNTTKKLSPSVPSLHTAVRSERLPQDPAMRRQSLTPRRPQPVQQRRGPLDIAEQQRQRPSRQRRHTTVVPRAPCRAVPGGARELLAINGGGDRSGRAGRPLIAPYSWACRLVRRFAITGGGDRSGAGRSWFRTRRHHRPPNTRPNRRAAPQVFDGPSRGRGLAGGFRCRLRTLQPSRHAWPPPDDRFVRCSVDRLGHSRTAGGGNRIGDEPRRCVARISRGP